MSPTRLAATLLFAVFMFGAGAVQAVNHTYSVTILLPFTPGQGSGVPTMINNRGLVCGNQADSRGFCHYRGVITDLQPFPGDTYSVPTGLNEFGQVVGYSYSSDGPVHIVRFVNGVAEPLTLTTNAIAYNVLDINNLGQVVGALSNVPGEALAYGTWFGVTRELGTLGGPRRIDSGNSINDLGQIVGQASRPGTQPEPGDQVAFLYERGVIRALPTPVDYNSNAAKINLRGQIVGSITRANSSETHPVMWEKGVLKRLGDQPGDARDINILGQVVGAIYSGNGGFLYHRTTGMRNLNTLIDPLSGFTIVYPQAINDLGQIVAYACKEGLCGPVRLDPVIAP